MAPLVLKHLHRKHDVHGPPSGTLQGGQGQVATEPAAGYVISSQPDATLAALPAAGNAGTSQAVPNPITPENALLAMHQTNSLGSSISTSTSVSTSSTSSPAVSPGLPPVPAKPHHHHHGPSFKKFPGLHLRSRSHSRDVSRAGSPSASAAAATSTQTSQPLTTAQYTSLRDTPPPIQRFPSRIELRAQYDRHGQMVRAVEEFYDYDATMPCLAYGTPPGPVGSDAFGRPPPYL
ncbi:hypothetical protein P389DRAFT_497 [Cystobasidium minutum MCA 4210]|uniref:uncharacterized protein n=1 Tax=Cystobasidium minutum MCA 4210 TaxID=1397322 RepID=UPI0034CE9B81|eukprot:jgi/Rhomi1/497/CE496_1352